jgi:Flp pilus assembly protein TadG
MTRSAHRPGRHPGQRGDHERSHRSDRTDESERGAATTEMVLVMPVLIAFLSMVVLAGRLTDARGDVVSAASDAARAASIQATAGAAATEAQSIAEDTLAGEGIECQGGADVAISYRGGGHVRGAIVQATVTCDVPTGDLALMNLPGVVTVREESWEPIDTHRSL